MFDGYLAQHPQFQPETGSGASNGVATIGHGTYTHSSTISYVVGTPVDVSLPPKVR